jgi:hypothetical protein
MTVTKTPATATQPGVVSTTMQTFSGTKKVAGGLLTPTLPKSGVQVLYADESNSFVHTGTETSITVSNMFDGQVVNINVIRAAGGSTITIAISEPGLTLKTTGTYSGLMTSTNSLFTLIRVGNSVFLCAAHGF